MSVSDVKLDELSTCGHCGGLRSVSETVVRHVRCTVGRVWSLTGRELDVMLLVGEGLDNRAIARHLQITERTVRAHLTSLMAKLGLRSRLQVGVVTAAMVCWCEPEPGA